MSRQPDILVVKIGTSTLIDSTEGVGAIDRVYLADFARQIAAVRESGRRVIVVTSAAITAGVEAMGLDARPTDIPSQQAAAAVGQSALSAAYSEALGSFGIVSGSVLLTRHDTANRQAYLHARDTLLRMLDLGVVPVVNENDTVSTEQIRFGDNDTLAALVSCLVKADACVIFSDIDGLYDANPRTNSNAVLIPTVERITPQILDSAEGVGSVVGSGGMTTKVKAARVLMAAGIPLTICNGREPDVLERLLAGEHIGTRFAAAVKPHEITPYKLWIALGDHAKGWIMVDAGAQRALIEKGSSLLSVGITKASGSFQSGDIVDILEPGGRIIARGKVSAGKDALELAKGKTQSQMAENSLLAPLAERPIIHRDELVVFE